MPLATADGLPRSRRRHLCRARAGKPPKPHLSISSVTFCKPLFVSGTKAHLSSHCILPIRRNTLPLRVQTQNPYSSYGTYQARPVEEYLKGNFGKITELSAYFVNSLYAQDRAITWETGLKEEYNKGTLSEEQWILK